MSSSQYRTALTVNGNSVTLDSGSGAYAAIDTGTTLVGGPQDAVSALYAQIEGSAPLTGNEGYWSYREYRPERPTAPRRLSLS